MHVICIVMPFLTEHFLLKFEHIILKYLSIICHARPSRFVGDLSVVLLLSFVLNCFSCNTMHYNCYKECIHVRKMHTFTIIHIHIYTVNKSNEL